MRETGDPARTLDVARRTNGRRPGKTAKHPESGPEIDESLCMYLQDSLRGLADSSEDPGQCERFGERQGDRADAVVGQDFESVAKGGRKG